MTGASETAMSKDEPLLSNCPLETAEPSRNYARVPGYKKNYKKKTRKRREKKRNMNGVEIKTRAYVATRLLLRWDYLYAVTMKTWSSGITTTRAWKWAGLLPRGGYFYAVTPALFRNIIGTNSEKFALPLTTALILSVENGSAFEVRCPKAAQKEHALLVNLLPDFHIGCCNLSKCCRSVHFFP